MSDGLRTLTVRTLLAHGFQILSSLRNITSGCLEVLGRLPSQETHNMRKIMKRFNVATTVLNSPDGAPAIRDAGSSRNSLQLAGLGAEIGLLREELRDDLLHYERDRLLRTMADFKNYRRRVERESDKLAEARKHDIILPLLGVVDDLKHAYLWASEVEQPLADYVRSIYQKLLVVLGTQGVRPFDSKGKLFTPDLHESVTVAEHESVGPGAIIHDVRRGPLWRAELLRPRIEPLPLRYHSFRIKSTHKH